MKKHLTIIAAMLLGIGTMTAASIADRMVKAPYSMAPATSSIKILWQLSDTCSLGKVYYGTDPQHLNLSTQSRGGWLVEGEGYVHIVQLTGLQPFTRYYFKVGDANETLDILSSTRTAPAAGTAFRIFTISDIHDNSHHIWENMQDSICQLGADLMMCNGDFVSDGAGRDWNDALFTPGRPFLSQTPLMSATGNHETGDPLTYRWSTFFDYFSQFSHGTPDDSIRDPRGEGYFAYDYGNARIIAVSVSGEPSSPLFSKTSPQFKWLDNELQTAKQDWILIFGHVGLTTSGYHGQWPPEYRTDWRNLFEKYAKLGKKIIYFCGDDHSFEHAYKDGVHYVRPGCGRNANYDQVKSLKDAQYTMLYRKVSCYSLLDMAADGSSLHMTTRDSASNVFYEYTFRLKDEQINPQITFTQPATAIEVVDSVNLQWYLFDPNKDAKVTLYYATQPDMTTTQGMTPIAQNLSSQTTRIEWQTRNIYPKGDYYLYATLTSNGQTFFAAKPYPIRLAVDTIAPPAPTNFAAWMNDGHFQLIWQNPTRLVEVRRDLTDFDNDINGIQVDNDDHSTSVLTHTDGTLQVDYTIGEAWEQTSADYVFPSNTNCQQTPILHFSMRGNGTSTKLRFVCKNMSSDHEDWWFTESISLSSSTWKDYTIDMGGLAAFSWYTNADTKNRCEGLSRLCFAISTSTTGSGTYYLDNLCLTGQINPAPDFEKVIIRRSLADYPTTIADGDPVYEGSAETYLDTEANPEQLYYYSAFALDDLGNVSKPALWLSTDLVSALRTTFADPGHLSKRIEKGQLIIQSSADSFSANGTKL